tara:strand:- start:1831 stop:2580 length:750 start_codon:yes stop_codon:yes gene_type:complete
MYKAMGKTTDKKYKKRSSRILKQTLKDTQSEVGLETFSTKNVGTAKFDKNPDSEKDIENLISKIKSALKKNNALLISLVWPDYHYIKQRKRYPHAGHTFGVSIDHKNKVLIVYDNSVSKKYCQPSLFDKSLGKKRVKGTNKWKKIIIKGDDITYNYHKIIDDIKEDYSLLFFKKSPDDMLEDNFLYKTIYEHEKCGDEDEGICHAHINTLQTMGLIKKYSNYDKKEKLQFLEDKFGKSPTKREISETKK